MESALEGYIKLKMLSKLADAVRQKERRMKRESPGREDDAASIAVDKTDDSVKPHFNQAALDKIFTHHRKGRISKKEALVLTLRGLGHVHRKIGEQFGVTESRISQIQTEAINKIKKVQVE